MDGRDRLRIINALLRYYMRLDPDSLTDEEWAMRYRELEWIRKKKTEGNSK